MHVLGRGGIEARKPCPEHLEMLAAQSLRDHNAELLNFVRARTPSANGVLVPCPPPEAIDVGITPPATLMRNSESKSLGVEVVVFVLVVAAAAGSKTALRHRAIAVRYSAPSSSVINAEATCLTKRADAPLTIGSRPSRTMRWVGSAQFAGSRPSGPCTSRTVNRCPAGPLSQPSAKSVGLRWPICGRPAPVIMPATVDPASPL